MDHLFTPFSGSVPHELTGLVDGEGPNGEETGVWLFGRPTGLIEAGSRRELEIACAAIDQASRSNHVIVLADYEVGSWFEPKLEIATVAHSRQPFQAWVFENADWLNQEAFEQWLAQRLQRTGADNQASGIAGLRAAISHSEYVAAAESALRHIAAGDLYQLNLTWRMDFTVFGPSLALYRKLRASQPVRHGAWLSLADRTVLSLSPELFLERRGDWLISRPMKGTRPRIRGGRSDVSLAEDLRRSEKDRAENLMIVDLIRNDLGKIAATGSVRVNRLFAIEAYPTLYQMISEVCAQVPDRSLYRTLEALFPCGSVTGAPKISAMGLIGSLEQSMRGIYTGTIGHVRPGGDFRFNVAIRTIELTANYQGHLHVGSGIVADSSADSEYAECWSKARFLTELPSDLALLETLLLENDEVKRFDAHLNRLKESAHFFGFKYDESVIRETVLGRIRAMGKNQHRLRLTLYREGGVDVQVQRLAELPNPLSFVLAPEPTESGDPLLRHKTTARKLYNDVLRGLKARPSVFDALFFNEREELTEGARSNVFLVKKGSWFTPPLESGLLNGIIRREILRTQPVHEKRLSLDDLLNADAVYLSNALRGLVRVWSAT